jgi:hypothetical protein
MFLVAAIQGALVSSLIQKSHQWFFSTVTLSLICDSLSLGSASILDQSCWWTHRSARVNIWYWRCDRNRRPNRPLYKVVWRKTSANAGDTSKPG